MLFDRVHLSIGKAVSMILIVTTQSLAFSFAYADTRFDETVVDANEYAREISSANNMPSLNSDGSVSLNGKVIMTGKEVTGQQDSDYVPGDTNVYGDDAATLVQGQLAQDTYNSKTVDTATSSSEKAYLIIKDSFSREKPDLTNDPMWENTDKVFANLSEISEDFANCTIKKQMVSTGKSYHVPKYETCEKLPAIEESFVIGHSYDVGIIRHKSGPLNLRSCGAGCMQVWIGTVGNNYWSGRCKIYEENMSVEVIQPDKITFAKLDRSKFDDYHQVYLNGTKIYNGPNGEFPPEVGTRCELSESWDKRPNVNITSSFRNLKPNGTLNFKTRTSVSGNGEGYSSLLIYYNQNDLVYNELWTTSEYIEKAIAIKKQAADGFCTADITCTNMPTLDSNKCTEINGIRVCENNFKNNPISELGLSPFCKSVSVKSDCAFNEGKICWTNMDGEEYCFDNDTQERNSCEAFEDSPTCSYIKTECVDGAEGPSGSCYVQEDTYDCGFDAGYGTQVEEETLVCDGQIQCIGEACYSPTRDGANGDFGKVNAYLEMLKYAQSDMTCEGVPEKPYNEQAPPDEYYPVSGCPAGYTYNKDGDVCLKQTTCSYSENDFYSVDLREGIQIVDANNVVSENKSITNCVPVINGGTAYTCGDLRLKQKTNTFYDVCTNLTAAPVSKTCPSAGHILNPKTGLCQVPPNATCDTAKYNLVSGPNAFSRNDDICDSIQVPSTTTCSSGYTLEGNTCRKQKVSNGACPNGGQFNSSSNQCWYEQRASLYCPSGSREGSRCKITTTSCSGGSSSGGDNRGGGPNKASYEPNSVFDFDIRPAMLLEIDGVVLEETYGDDFGFQKIRGGDDRNDRPRSCSKSTYYTNAKCPSGYTKNGSSCVKIKTYTASNYCDSGWTLDSGNRSCSTYTNSYQVCNNEMILTTDETMCIYTPRTVKPEYSCPSQYPNWSEEEQRCMSKSDSPLAAVLDERTFYQNHKHIIDQLLNPVGSLLSGVIPSAHADTQSAMNEYAVTGVTEAISEDSTTDGAGDANVTCSLFKGEAEECKIAVGGMQNCCKAPVTPNLGDYIKLTTSMIQMDAMTGSMELIEGYSGLWNEASGAVEGLFSSAADTATGTVGETATGGLVDQAAQEVMKYASDWLTEQFSKETAQMFFQETITSTGTTAMAPSAGLAAVGTALMVVYYAYLAYVVFTLLVNIIYECTPDEMNLAMKRELLSTHYLGSYCKSKVLGACIEKRQSYCMFDSPLSRIMMEQIYQQPQMGLSWGTPKEPNCTGLELQDVVKVDWDKVNLDEWVGILIKSDALKAATDINVDSLTGAGSYLNRSETSPRDNVIDSTEKRSEGMDADQIRNDSSNEQWNDLQQTE